MRKFVNPVQSHFNKIREIIQNACYCLFSSERESESERERERERGVCVRESVCV